MKFYEDELNFGLMGELSLKETIEKYFYTKPLEKLSLFHPFDYHASTCYFEIKTRRTKKDAFKTTLISYNKFKFSENLDISKKAYFIFQFTDGVYYYKYEKNDINLFEQKLISRRDRNIYEMKNHILLPNEKLIKLE